MLQGEGSSERERGLPGAAQPVVVALGLSAPLVSALLHHPLSMCQNELSGDMTAGTAGSRGPVSLVGGGDSGKSLKQKPDCTGLKKNKLGGNQADSSEPAGSLARKGGDRGGSGSEGREAGGSTQVSAVRASARQTSLPSRPLCPRPVPPPLPASSSCCPSRGSCGPSLLRAIPAVISSSGCVGRSPTCISTLQWVGERSGEEKR